ncbi:hypothetical protein D9615_005093 [Tricholomella constricta]|uniref:Retrotransposon gag domain-containing protein n=1 Tax=Tricholomella constricta TaxID=117010 RepID=A0A8H5HHE1_9AGAR|nr:hypothetical protein D9615_005093 [Tricholomella constricta]
MNVDHAVFYARFLEPPHPSIPMPPDNQPLLIIITVHVDDGLVATNSEPLYKWVLAEMNKSFKVVDLGAASLYLGIRVTRDLPTRKLWLSQLSGELSFTLSDAHRLFPDSRARPRPTDRDPDPTLRPKRRCTYLLTSCRFPTFPACTRHRSRRPDTPTSAVPPRARTLSHEDRTAAGTLRAETRVCYTQPVQCTPAPIVAQSRLEMSDFGEFDTPPSPAALTPEERLASLETAMVALSQSNTTNSATMDRIAALLDTIVLGNPSAASPAAPTTPATPTQPLPMSPPLPRSGSHIRPSPPPVYDGARSGGRAFWNACQLYFSLSVGQFADDHARISWVLSYMQHGRAADFVGRVFQYGSVKRAFPTWKDFASNFEKEFFLFDEVADAALTLESTAYFQNGRTIEEYIDSFKALWIKADYPDGRHLVLKFRQGMDPKLSRRLGSITTGRPDDSKIEDWLAIARSQDFIMRTEEDFHRRSAPTVPTASRPTAPIPMPVVAPMLRWRPTAPPTAPVSLWTSTGSVDVLFRTTPVVDASSRGTSGVTAQSALTCATSCRRNWMS